MEVNAFNNPRKAYSCAGKDYTLMISLLALSLSVCMSLALSPLSLWVCTSLSLSLSLSSRPFSNVRDVASSVQHGAGGRSLMEVWGIYPTFCVYLCLSVRVSAAYDIKGIHLEFEAAAAPPRDQAHLASNSGATCLRAKRRKTCFLRELWKRSWPTRRSKRLIIRSCAKPARWHSVS